MSLGVRWHEGSNLSPAVTVSSPDFIKAKNPRQQAAQSNCRSYLSEVRIKTFPKMDRINGVIGRRLSCTRGFLLRSPLRANSKRVEPVINPGLGAGVSLLISRTLQCCGTLVVTGQLQTITIPALKLGKQKLL